MSRLICLLTLTALLLAAPPATAQPATVRLAFFPVPPHSYFDPSRQPEKGAALVVAEEAMAAIGYRVEWIGPLTIPRIKELALNGEVDGVISAQKSPDREAIFAYPQAPTYVHTPILAVRADSATNKIRTIDDIRGWTILHLSGGGFPDFIGKNASELKIHFIASSTWIEQALEMLELGRADAVLGLNRWTLPYVSRANGHEGKFRYLNIPESPIPTYIAFSKSSPLMPQILDRYNQAFKSPQQDRYEALMAGYFQ